MTCVNLLLKLLDFRSLLTANTSDETPVVLYNKLKQLALENPEGMDCETAQNFSITLPIE